MKANARRKGGKGKNTLGEKEGSEKGQSGGQAGCGGPLSLFFPFPSVLPICVSLLAALAAASGQLA